MLEALVGFKFNVVQSNMATKRPLVIHMIPSQAAEHATPHCTLAGFDINSGAHFTRVVDVLDLPAQVTAQQPAGNEVPWAARTLRGSRIGSGAYNWVLDAATAAEGRVARAHRVPVRD
jgi:hypothetical protein